MGAQTYSLEERLQAEFCPPLDSSLIAAFIYEYCPDGQVKPSSQAEQTLRSILSELAAQAEKDEESVLSERLSNFDFGTTCSVTDDTSSAHDIFSNDTQVTSSTTISSNASETSSSNSSPQPFSSPLGFLQTAFPDIPTHRLRSILSSMGDVDDLNMVEVVDHICSLEYVRELEQRGIDGLDADDRQEDLTPWLTVHNKKTVSPSALSKKQQKRRTTFVFGDVRQKQHIRSTTVPGTSSPSGNGTAAPDPWTQISSLASHLNSLIPSVPASQFQSAFHSPKYASPSAAIRAICGSFKSLDESAETVSAIAIFEFLESSEDFATLSPSECEQVMSDARLAIRATEGQPDNALEVVQLLRELDSDAVSGEVEWRLYHSPTPPPLSKSQGTPSSSAARRTNLKLQLPTEPPPIPAPPPTTKQRPSLSSASSDSWTTITPTRKAGSTSHPLADFIPAYNANNVPTKHGKRRGGVNGPGNKKANGVRDGNGGYSSRVHDLMRQRTQALKEAGRAWQNGNSKSRGGEVAFYYAEKARQLHQQAFRAQLAVAQGKVEATRQYSKHGDQVDLHGTTVAEAIHIVREILEEECPSSAKPLKIITGRGRHSFNGVGVLGPAIKSALAAEGWDVGTWDAGLVVRGKLSP